MGLIKIHNKMLFDMVLQMTDKITSFSLAYPWDTPKR